VKSKISMRGSRLSLLQFIEAYFAKHGSMPAPSEIIRCRGFHGVNDFAWAKKCGYLTESGLTESGAKAVRDATHLSRIALYK
jgi:hypothetical protein